MPLKASKKHRRHNRLRTEVGKFLKKSGSKNHDDGDDGSPLNHIHQGKNIKRATLETFHKRDMIAKRATRVCHACVHKLENDKSFDGFLPCKETDQNKTFSLSLETENDNSTCNSLNSTFEAENEYSICNSD